MPKKDDPGKIEKRPAVQHHDQDVGCRPLALKAVDHGVKRPVDCRWADGSSSSKQPGSHRLRRRTKALFLDGLFSPAKTSECSGGGTSFAQVPPRCSWQLEADASASIAWTRPGLYQMYFPKRGTRQTAGPNHQRVLDFPNSAAASLPVKSFERFARESEAWQKVSGMFFGWVIRAGSWPRPTMSRATASRSSNRESSISRGIDRRYPSSPRCPPAPARKVAAAVRQFFNMVLARARPGCASTSIVLVNY